MSNAELAETVARLFVESGGGEVRIPADLRAEMNAAAADVLCSGFELDAYYQALTLEYRRLGTSNPELPHPDDGEPFSDAFFRDGLPGLSDRDLIRLLAYGIRLELFAELLVDSYCDRSAGPYWMEAIARSLSKVG